MNQKIKQRLEVLEEKISKAVDHGYHLVFDKKDIKPFAGCSKNCMWIILDPALKVNSIS